MSARKIAIVGSTGSIGTSTLEVVAAHPQRFIVDCLVAGRRGDLLAKQVRAVRPRVAAVSDADGFKLLCEGLGVSTASARWNDTELVCGEDAILAMIRESKAEVVVAAVVGMAGLNGVLAAIESGKDIALANKESLAVPTHATLGIFDHYSRASVEAPKVDDGGKDNDRLGHHDEQGA